MFLSEQGFDMFSLLPIPILLAICSIVPVILAALKIKKIPAFTIHIIIGMALGSFAKSKELFTSPLMEGIYTVGMGFFLLLSGLDTDYSVIFKRKQKNDINVSVFKISWILMLSVILLSLVLSIIFLFIFPLEIEQAKKKIEIILLITILFSSTFASVVIPIIHERSFAKTTIGQIICTYATIAELFSIISLSALMIFDKIKHNQEPWLLIVAFGILIIVYLIKKYSPTKFIKKEIDGFTQLPVRIVTYLLLSMMLITYKAGAEFILGAFLSGAIIKAADISHHSMEKIEAVGYGLFVPLFFVLLGVKMPFSHLIHDSKVIWMSLLVFGFLLIAKAPFLYLAKYYKKNTYLPSTILVSITMIVAIALEHFHIFPEEYAFAFIFGSALTAIVPPIIFYSIRKFDECRPEFSHVIIEPHEIEHDENHKVKKHKFH